jgi:plastocyanin
VLAALLGGVVIALSACGNGPPEGGGGGTGSDAYKPVTGQTAAQVVKASDDNKFNPHDISVKGGDVVQWDNPGSIGHNVTLTGYDSATLDGGGGKVQFQFVKAGTYEYQCTIHPGMNGTVAVTGSAATPSASAGATSPGATGSPSPSP